MHRAHLALFLTGLVIGCGSSAAAPASSTDDTGTTPIAETGGDETAPPPDATTPDTAPPPPVETAWVKTTVPGGLSLTDLHALAPDDVWGIANESSKGTIVHWDGKEWKESQALAAPGKAIWAVSKSDVWALSDYPGTAWRYDGSSWKKQSTFGVSSVYSLWASGGSDVWVGSQWNFGGQSPVRRFDGSKWSMVDTGNQSGVSGLWGSGPSDVWGGGEKLQHYTAGAWSVVEATNPFAAFWGSAKDNIIGVGKGGTIKRYDGSAWTSMPNDSKSDLRSVYVASKNAAWAGGYSSFLVWDGTAWTDGTKKEGAPKNVGKITGTSASDVWVAVGSDAYHLVPK